MKNEQRPEVNNMTVSFFLDDWRDIQVNRLKSGTFTVSVKSYPTTLTLFIADPAGALLLAKELNEAADRLEAARRKAEGAVTP